MNQISLLLKMPKLKQTNGLNKINSSNKYNNNENFFYINYKIKLNKSDQKGKGGEDLKVDDIETK